MKNAFGREVDVVELENFSNNVVQDMLELKKLGMKVPNEAIELAKDTKSSNEDSICNYMDMKVSECADLLIQLAQIK